MRIDIIEKFSTPNNSKISCYLFSENVTGVKNTNNLLLNDQLDLLHLGTENGKIFFILIANGGLPIHNFRPLDMTKDIDTRHAAEISCIMFSISSVFNTQNIGLLFSGSLDRSIKVWSINTDHSSTYVQTLFGHTSKITSIIDGKDGTIISCSEDSTLRVWSPQRGRNIMLYPFFECTFILTFDKDVWLTSLAISSLGPWICYVADSNGNIEVLKKGSSTENSIESHVKKFMKQLTKYSRWEKVHNLGISYLEMISDENILVTLSYDCTAKFTDPTTGQLLYHVSNIRKCMYTGITWLKHMTSFYLIDEFGYLEVFNLYHERVVETVELCEVNSKQVTAILKFHAQKAISCLHRFNQDGYYLSIVANDQKSDTSSISSSTATRRRKTVGIQGDVFLWQLSNDVNCQEFAGHEGAVTGIMVPNNNLAMQQQQFYARNKTSLQISREERIFFSAGNEDDTIRCWDEYDRTENYQLKNKAKDLSEITVVHAIWYINRIATGHENGTVCVWNVDTGTNVISRILRSTVSSLVEGSDSKRCRLLIGSDYNGKIASWNLTLHSMNPNVLSQVGGIINGYHLKEDPGILSLAFHERTKTIFSGGNDCNICFWNLNSDIISGRANIHEESINLLKCTDTFLLSGDTLGNLYLSRVIVEKLNYSTQGSEIVKEINILCSWNTHPITMNAMGDICELDLTIKNDIHKNDQNIEAIVNNTSISHSENNSSSNHYTGGKHVLVTQILGEGRSKVWEVWTQKRSNLASNNRSNRSAFTMNNLAMVAAKMNAQDSTSHSYHDMAGNNPGASDMKSNVDSDEMLLKCKIYHITNKDLYIFANELYTLNHDKYDISCCTMTYLDNSSLESFRSSALVYLGTIAGGIFRYSFEKIKSL